MDLLTRPVGLPPFQRLLDLHALDVHRFLVACVGPTDADDCYQETWIAALRAYPGLASTENLRGWVFTIARHKALDLLRARARGPVPVGDALPDSWLASGVDGDAVGPGRPSAGLVGPLGTEPQLWQAVAGLAPKQRTAVALRFILDADYATVAAMMDISEAAARRNVHEALKRLAREDLDVD